MRRRPGGDCASESQASELVWRADRLGHDDLGRFGGAPDRADEGLQVRVGHERLELLDAFPLVHELLAEDLVDHNPYPGQAPGLDGHNQAVAMIRRAFPDLRFTAYVVVSDEQFVTGRWTMTGTNTGPFDLFGLPPTGRPVTMTGQEIFRARDGKLAEIWHQEDAPGMLR